jgi:uncharacterized membrane protein YdcZ (DUF606 family)
MYEYKTFGICSAYAQILMLWLWFWGFLTNWWVILSPLLLSLFGQAVAIVVILCAILIGDYLRKLNARKH